ncbi:Avirulence protein (Avh) [Phytophthora palmivora]|uniref:Avirulence protein (Avh) n=1 Tax=Phytophthora palmivora TaxID=4796 RepID=A0A2P4XRK6_9STRA|nr:Avirulence protein (Avh) [Phytophthora palmivora]
MIETFTHTLGDIDVTKILHALKRKDMTRNIATELESAQLKMWLNGKKSTDDVFKLLKLDNEANSFRDKPLFNTWISYINSFITENPDQKARVFSALETRFSDRPLNSILNAASNFPSMESTAINIQTSKIQGYVASNKSPYDVFTLLGIDDVGYHVLSTSVFQSWLRYVEDFNKRNPMHKESWSKTAKAKSKGKAVPRKEARKAASTSSPAKSLTLAEGKARAQAAKAASHKRADEDAAAAKKRATPGSPTSEPSIAKKFRSLFDSSDEDEEEGVVTEPQEISNDLDVQQERYQVTQLQGAPAPPTPVNLRGYYPLDARSGVFHIRNEIPDCKDSDARNVLHDTGLPYPWSTLRPLAV